jgi:hypothetical protein
VKGQIANAQAVVTAAQRRLETALRAKRAGFGHLLLCEYLDDPGSGGLGTICGFLATQALAQLHDVSRLQEPGRCPLDEMSEIVAAAQGFVVALQALCVTHKTLRKAEARTNQSIAAGSYPQFQHTQPIPHHCAPAQVRIRGGCAMPPPTVTLPRLQMVPCAHRILPSSVASAAASHSLMHQRGRIHEGAQHQDTLGNGAQACRSSTGGSLCSSWMPQAGW